MIRKLMEIFSAELKIPYENLDQDTSFTDYGVDSILLVQLVKKAEVAFQIKIEPSAFLEYPSFSQLGVYFNELFASEGSVLKLIQKTLRFGKRATYKSKCFRSTGQRISNTTNQSEPNRYYRNGL